MKYNKVDELRMTFQPNTIQHLGVKMYSTVPPALAELIANAYDACSNFVNIDLIDNDIKSIIVKDEGIGMSFNEVNDYFLRIGRNRREENQKNECEKRQPTGKKGLGKLALFGIGDTIEIITTKEGETVSFILDWNEILKCPDTEYKPKYNRTPAQNGDIGTKIILTNLKRKTGFPLEDYAISIAKMFDFADDFIVNISLNGENKIEIDNKTKYKNIDSEFEWNIQDIIEKIESNYEFQNEVQGKIVTTEKPLKPNLRGVTLFANGRLINLPEFFVDSESSHFYSYATGWLNVNFLDLFDDDLIATNRQSIDWEHSQTQNLKDLLSRCILLIEKEWREKRKDQKRNKVKAETNINVEHWYATLPNEIQDKVEGIVNIVDDASQLPEEAQQETIRLLHELVPEYPNLHWRNLEPEIQVVSEKYYQNNDYYSAFIEGLKRYVSEVKKKTGKANIDERALMQAVFNKRVLSVTKKYSKIDGTPFDNRTIDNIEVAQQMLSEGIVTGGGNPIQHEEIQELSLTGLFSEKDCLDFLSLLSHLFKRLNNSEAP